MNGDEEEKLFEELDDDSDIEIKEKIVKEEEKQDE